MEGRKAWAEVDAILAAYDRRQYDVMVANYDNRSDNDSRISTKLTGEVSIDGVRYTVSSSQFLYERRPRDVHGWGVWTRCTEAEAAKVANSDKWQTRRWVLDVATGEHKPEYPSYEALLLALRQLHDAVRGWPEPGGPSVVEAQKRAEELLNAKPVTPPWE